MAVARYEDLLYLVGGKDCLDSASGNAVGTASVFDMDKPDQDAILLEHSLDIGGIKPLYRASTCDPSCLDIDPHALGRRDLACAVITLSAEMGLLCAGGTEIVSDVESP